MARILVTGATGFVGRALSMRLSNEGHDVLRVSRQSQPAAVNVGDIDLFDRWEHLLEGVEVVMHLAGRAHVLKKTGYNALAEFRRVNARATLRLLRASAECGVRRFVFVSSIGVNGTATTGVPFDHESIPRPSEPYAISKWEAEQGIRAFCTTSTIQWVIVRPPLVYGPGAKGNFARLLRLVHSGMPLPLASISNLRSYIGLANLCDFLALCAFHPGAARELFVISDGEDVSTPSLIEHIARGLQTHARLFRCPLPLLKFGATLAGRNADIQRLTSSLQVNPKHAKRCLAWEPTLSLASGIDAMARDYVARIEHAS